MALNTITDIFLMAIPLPVSTLCWPCYYQVTDTNWQIIWKARLDTKRKISLMILFSGGWIVIIFGILRCVTLVTVRSHLLLTSVSPSALNGKLTKSIFRSVPQNLPSPGSGLSANPSSPCWSATLP